MSSDFEDLNVNKFRVNILITEIYYLFTSL